MPTNATNSDMELTVTVMNAAKVPVNPDAIELRWKLGKYGDWNTVSQASLAHPSTGVYIATVNPSEASTWFGVGMQGRPAFLRYEFHMTNPTYVKSGKISLATMESCQ